MTRELISKTTRNEFREVLVGFTLREIEMAFDAGGLVPLASHQPSVSGQRRGLVEAYYGNIDFASAGDVKKLLSVYKEIIEQLKRTQDRVINPELVDETVATLLRRMARDGYHYAEGRFVSAPNVAVASTPCLVQLNDESIQEHIEKARQKISNDDASGAIASAYTLVEQFLKQLLLKTGTPFKESEGDIRALYKLVAAPLNLAPNGESLRVLS